VSDAAKDGGVKHFTDTEYELLRPRLASDSSLWLLELELRTGIRQEEAIRIRPQDVRGGIVYVEFPAKGSMKRAMPVSSDFEARLRLALQKPHPAISSKSLKQLWRRRLEKCCKGIGIQVRKPHSLRHTFAIRYLRECKDIRKVQVALGHKSITSTMFYLQFVEFQEEHPNILRAVG
jgi:integrase